MFDLQPATLSVDGFLLLRNESIEVLREGDLIRFVQFPFRVAKMYHCRVARNEVSSERAVLPSEPETAAQKPPAPPPAQSMDAETSDSSKQSKRKKKSKSGTLGDSGAIDPATPKSGQKRGHGEPDPPQALKELGQAPPEGSAAAITPETKAPKKKNKESLSTPDAPHTSGPPATSAAESALCSASKTPGLGAPVLVAPQVVPLASPPLQPLRPAAPAAGAPSRTAVSMVETPKASKAPANGLPATEPSVSKRDKSASKSRPAVLGTCQSQTRKSSSHTIFPDDDDDTPTPPAKEAIAIAPSSSRNALSLSVSTVPAVTTHSPGPAGTSFVVAPARPPSIHVTRLPPPNYSLWPALQGSPRVGDILAFKVRTGFA